MEEGPEPHPRVLLQIQLPHLQGGGVGEVEDQVPRLPWAVPRGVEDSQRREATRVHALHGASLQGPHQHQTQGFGSIYRVDQAR